MNWRDMFVVFGATVLACVAYDVLVGPTLASLATGEKPKAAA